MSCHACPHGGYCSTCAALLARAEGTPVVPMSEAQFLARVREVAKRVGDWRAYHTFCSKRSEPGFPDLVLVRAQTEAHAGRLIFSELKREGEAPTIPQQKWLEALGASVAGVECYLWHPSDLDNIVEILLRK